jgi:hypothetical protein
VNIRCNHCGNSLSIDEASQGQPIRCPQCQQVMGPSVTGPLPQAPHLPEESAAITFTPPEPGEHDSIFAGPEHTEDGLFGAPVQPRLELPPETPPVALPPEAPPGVSVAAPCSSDALFDRAALVRPEQAPHPSLPPPGAVFSTESSRTETPPPQPLAAPAEATTAAVSESPPFEFSRLDAAPASGATSPASDVVTFEPVHGQAPAFIAPGIEAPASAVSESAPSFAPPSFAANLPRRAFPTGMRSGLFLALVIIPLISYSVLATIAILILYLRPPQPSLDFLPDIDGDLRGAKHQKRSALTYERLEPDSPLPDRLKVALGRSIRLGDVEVTPERVALRRVKVRHPDLSVSEMPGESLILYVRFKNASGDVVFSPTDPYFDRLHKSSQDSKPYMFLEIAGQRYYGGALPWSPGARLEERPIIEGQVFQVLQPGEQLSTLVCTDPDAEVGKALAGFRGKLVWRIQVRRGLVRASEREVPATAVIGVEFTNADIEKPQV